MTCVTIGRAILRTMTRITAHASSAAGKICAMAFHASRQIPSQIKDLERVRVGECPVCPWMWVLMAFYTGGGYIMPRWIKHKRNIAGCDVMARPTAFIRIRRRRLPMEIRAIQIHPAGDMRGVTLRNVRVVTARHQNNG